MKPYYEAESKLMLVKVEHEMKFADGVRADPSVFGTIFRFIDRSGHVHAEYQIGNPVSHPPTGAIGAVREPDGWYWVVREDPESGMR